MSELRQMPETIDAQYTEVAGLNRNMGKQQKENRGLHKQSGKNETSNRKYKRTISMRTSMPSDKAVIFLLAAVAMEETKKTYAKRIYQFKNWKEKIKNEWKERTE